MRGTFRRIVQDTWAYLSYKASFDTGAQPHQARAKLFAPPSWVPEEDKRRLEAYKYYDALYRLQGREWMGPGAPDEVIRTRREYGDPHVLVETALSSLLGDKFGPLVKGSVTEGTDAASQLQQWIEEWMDKEHFTRKVYECERNATKLGDGVYVLGIDPRVNRVRLGVWDPGFFFPSLEQQHLRVDDFPNVANIAYEFVLRQPDGNDKNFVRRIHWELIEVPPYVTGYGEPATLDCLYSDGYWATERMGADAFALNDSQVDTWITEPVMLKVDFIPVIHIPNFVAESEFWGTPVVASVVQLLDDICAMDTDVQASASTTGSPPIAISNVLARPDDQGNILTYGPGQILEMGDGSATVVDTSNGLLALKEMKNDLLSRLSVNGRTPEALLGRVKPNEVPSGIALTLGFTQHTNMIREMRLVRHDKYRLLFKFLVRMSQSLGSPVYSTTDMTFGSYMPSDMEQAMEQVVQGLNSHAMSRETAVTILYNAGFPIDDIGLEVERITQQDTDDAVKMLDATGDPNVVRDMLGLPLLPTNVQPTTEATQQEDIFAE